MFPLEPEFPGPQAVGASDGSAVMTDGRSSDLRRDLALAYGPRVREGALQKGFPGLDQRVAEMLS
jgi:hypothetical protein